jgi:hypothetical protein
MTRPCLAAGRRGYRPGGPPAAERSQYFLDEPRIRPAFGAFCGELPVGTCLTRLRLAESRLRLARRSTALGRCRRSRPVFRRSRAGCDLADHLHGGGVPGLVCLTPYQFNLILQLAYCCLCHRRSSQFSVTLAVVRCQPGSDIAPALDQPQTEAAMREYLECEINLVNDMATDDDHHFQVARG